MRTHHTEPPERATHGSTNHSVHHFRRLPPACRFPRRNATRPRTRPGPRLRRAHPAHRLRVLAAAHPRLVEVLGTATGHPRRAALRRHPWSRGLALCARRKLPAALRRDHRAFPRPARAGHRRRAGRGLRSATGRDHARPGLRILAAFRYAHSPGNPDPADPGRRVPAALGPRRAGHCREPVPLLDPRHSPRSRSAG